MRWIPRGGLLTLVIFLFVAGPRVSQAQQQNGTLTIAGHTGQAPVIQLDGRPYVAIDALARLMNGSLGYRGNQITLTLSGTPGAQTPPPASRAFSSEFLNAAIETMSDIREWRSALLTAVDYGSPAIEKWMDPYQAQARKNLRLASVAASTDSDRDTLQLLSKELDHMQQLNDKVMAAQETRSYITAASLKNDPLDQKIIKCAHALGEMAASGLFQDDGSCH